MQNLYQNLKQVIIKVNIDKMAEFLMKTVPRWSIFSIDPVTIFLKEYYKLHIFDTFIA